MNVENNAAPSPAEITVPALEKKSGEPRRLDRSGFPHPPLERASQLPGTIENLAFMLDQHEIEVHFDVIKKRIEYARRGGAKSTMNEVLSLAALNGFPTNHIYAFIDELSVLSPANPIRDWIQSVPWDGKDRLEEMLATVTPHGDYPDQLKTPLMTRWLLSLVAAALTKSGFHTTASLAILGARVRADRPLPNHCPSTASRDVWRATGRRIVAPNFTRNLNYAYY